MVRLPAGRSPAGPVPGQDPQYERKALERVHVVGDRIRSFRTRQGISQEALALEAGFGTQSAISRCESGDRIPDLVSIILIADALHVEPVDLMNVSNGYRAKIIDELRDAPVSVLREIFHFLMDLKDRASRASVGA